MTEKRLKALITGGSGYFGSLLMKRMQRRGYECSVFDLNDADDRPAEVPLIRGDIRDYDTVRRACEGIDVVHHNVAQVPLAKNRGLFESVNIRGTENLLKACLDAGVGKVVYTSSSAVFGIPKQNPVTETTEPHPMEAYGRAKLVGEHLCHEYAGKDLDVSIIRPRTILGHGRLGIFQILFEWIREGANVPVLGKGDNVYQFIHADDMADACILAGERAGSDTYNCGTDRFGTMREVLEHLCEHAGTGSMVKGVPMKPAEWGMKITNTLGMSPLGAYHALMYGRSMYFDISKAQRHLDWKPRFSSNEMFVDSYEWYLRNREAVLRGTGSSFHRSALRQGVLRLVKWWL